MTLDQLYRRLAHLEAENAELRAANGVVVGRLAAIIPAMKWLLLDKRLRHPKTSRDVAIITSCEHALETVALPEKRK